MAVDELVESVVGVVDVGHELVEQRTIDGGAEHGGDFERGTCAAGELGESAASTSRTVVGTSAPVPFGSCALSAFFDGAEHLGEEEGVAARPVEELSLQSVRRALAPLFERIASISLEHERHSQSDRCLQPSNRSDSAISAESSAELGAVVAGRGPTIIRAERIRPIRCCRSRVSPVRVMEVVEDDGSG